MSTDQLDYSIAQQLSLLAPEEMEEALDGMDIGDLLHDWSFWGRPSQLFQPPYVSEDMWIGLYIAGRGCVHSDTRIYLPMTNEHIPVRVLAERGQPVTVLTLNGPQRTDGAPFVKLASAPMYTVTTEDGLSVTVTDQHRFLTPEGWRQLADVHVGQLLAAVPHAAPSAASSSQSACLEDAQRCSRTAQGSQCGCPTCHRSGDPRPLPLGENDRDASPSQGGADGHTQPWWLLDDQATSPGCSRSCQHSDHQPKSGSSPSEPWLGVGPHRDESTSRGHTLPTPREAHRPLDRCGFRRTDEPLLAGLDRSSYAAPTLSGAMRHFAAHDASRESRRPTAGALVGSNGLSPRTSLLDHSASRRADTPQRSRHGALPVVAGQDEDVSPQRDVTCWTRVVSIGYVGDFPVYDLTVPGEEHYLAEGLFHHNTGKTRSASEFADYKANAMPGSRGIMVARTAADTRDVLVEGESGVLNIGDPATRPKYEPSKRRLTWKNQSTATLFTAEEPDQLRGPQGHWAICDELATWSPTPDSSGLTSWDHVRIGTRLGKQPQILALTTPKRTPLMKAVLQLAEEKDNVILRRGRTADNLGNLSSAYLDVIYGLYGGTRLALQELEGEMLDDVEGALWNQAQLDATRIEPPNHLPRVPLIFIIAVDPSVAENPTDECGIVVCASTCENDLYKRQFFIVEDCTVYGSPNVWASKVVEMANLYGAPVVAETNQGGALVRNALVNIDPNIKVHEVRARYGKLTRAEPVALAFEQGRGHMLGWWPDLESQLISWTPADRKSPDRLDAMVWGATALLIKPPPGLYTSSVRAHSVASMRISAAANPLAGLNAHVPSQFPYLASRGFSIPGMSGGPPGYPYGGRRRRNRAYNRKLPTFSVTIPR